MKLTTRKYFYTSKIRFFFKFYTGYRAVSIMTVIEYKEKPAGKSSQNQYQIVSCFRCLDFTADISLSPRMTQCGKNRLQSIYLKVPVVIALCNSVNIYIYQKNLDFTFRITDTQTLVHLHKLKFRHYVTFPRNVPQS